MIKMIMSDKFKAKLKKAVKEDPVNYFHKLLDSKWSPFTVWYRLDWRKKEIRNVQEWLKEQVEYPHAKLTKVADGFRGLTNDEKMEEILRYVKQRTVYLSDTRFSTTEYWQEAITTFNSNKGDCEDGAILILILARLANVPFEQVRLQCGPVQSPRNKNKTDGHAYVVYRADKDFKWYHFDWCYYPDLRGIYRRDNTLDRDWRYKREWWSVNDERGYGRVRLK
jgi:transglutaminase-like putative cysteine protease